MNRSMAVRSPEQGRRRRRRLAWAAVIALALVVVMRPFQAASPLDWVIVGSNEHGERLHFGSQTLEWGVARTGVATFHASDRPGDRRQAFRHRVEADVRLLTALGPVRQKLSVTQPKGAIVDPATGKPRSGIDGVTGLFQVRGSNGWETLERIELEPSATSWQDHVVDIPQGSTTVALEWTPRATVERDFLMAAFELPETKWSIPLMAVTRLGEFLLVALIVFIGSYALEAFLALVSRVSSVPPVRVDPPGRPAFRLHHLVLLAVVLGASLVVAILAGPWREAATTPVRIDWAEPDGASLDVFFGEGPDDHVPAVWLDSNHWGAELPPRPSYRIALELPLAAAQAESTLGAVRLVGHLESGASITIARQDLKPAASGASVAREAASRATARLAYPEEIRIGRMSWFDRIGVVWLGVSAAFSLLLFCLFAIARRPATSDARTGLAPGPIWPLAIAGSLGAMMMIAWAVNTPTIVTPDTGGYLMKAEVFATGASFETGGQAGELTRTPGYPVFLATVLKLFGHSLVAIALAQGLLHAFALFFVALSLRRSVRTAWLAAGIVLGSAWLSHLHYARLMISESVFVSLSLIALGCFFFARSAPRPKDLWWLAGFAVATIAAVFTRTIAVVLLAVPAATWFSGIVALWKSEPSRSAWLVKSARLTLPHVLVAGAVIAAVLGWSYRNWRERGFFGFAAMTALTNLQGEVHSEMLDPRVLVPYGFYPGYVRDRASSGYSWTVWNIYMDLFHRADAEQVPRRKIIRFVENRYDDLYRASTAAMPIPARWAGFLRMASWNLRTLEGREYYWNFDMPSEEVRDRNERWAGVPMEGHDARPGAIADALRPVAAWYPEMRIGLLVLACLGGLAMLGRGVPAFAGPFLFMVAYLLILSHLRQRELRYLVILDVFCILQVIIALGWKRPEEASSP